jgi:hypothetical protein
MPRPPGDASLTQKLFKYEPPSLMAARTTRLTGDGMVLELEELLELDRLLLELEDDGGTRDELLLSDGELELLKTLLVEELLLDGRPELELTPGDELEDCTLLLDEVPGLELLDPPGMLLLELWPGMDDEELE